MNSIQLTNGSALEARDISQISKSTLLEIARLHHIQLPTSSICLFGLRGTAFYYRYAISSQSESLVISRTDSGAIAGIALVSFDRKTLANRAFIKGLWLFAPMMAFKPETWKKLSRKLARPAPSKSSSKRHTLDNNPRTPELLQIFVAVESVGKGIGGSLLKLVETIVQARGASGFLVRTENAPENRALKFYSKNGFIPIGNSTDLGKELAVFYKERAS